MENTYLAHHGVKGQKWGVRRYENYDGSYTRAGMKRYNASKAEYDKTSQRVKDAKAAYKFAKKNSSDTGLTKTELTNAKLANKAAKRQLDKDYKHLKQDKLGDQGKELYANGKTITGNSSVTKALSSIGAMSIAASNALYNSGSSNTKAMMALNAIGGLSLAAAAGSAVKGANQNRKLRAYYNHTSNY